MFMTSAFACATLTTLNTSWQSGHLASSHIASVKWVAWTKTAIVNIIIVNINKHLQHHHSTTNCIIFNWMPDRLRGGDAGRCLLGRRQCVQEGRAGCLWRRCGGCGVGGRATTTAAVPRLLRKRARFYIPLQMASAPNKGARLPSSKKEEGRRPREETS